MFFKLFRFEIQSSIVMANKKIDNNSLSNIINEHLEADQKMNALQQELKHINSLMERYESGEEITEEELNELLGGLSAVGKWGRDKVGQVGQQAWNAAKGAAQDVQHQFQKGQRAASINKQRQKVDKQQVSNNKKVQQLAVKGKEINDAIRAYRIQLSDIAAEYKELTGKDYVPGRAIANAQRYINESFDDGIGISLRSLLDGELAIAAKAIDLSNYKERNKLIDEIERRLNENDWITMSNGTTFEKTFTPGDIKNAR